MSAAREKLLEDFDFFVSILSTDLRHVLKDMHSHAAFSVSEVASGASFSLCHSRSVLLFRRDSVICQNRKHFSFKYLFGIPQTANDFIGFGEGRRLYMIASSII